MIPRFSSMQVVDSHTGGEPTRVILAGGPVLSAPTPAARAAELREKHAAWCKAAIAEPRGCEALVGALLLPPLTSSCLTSVIFFDSAGPLGMCGHGLIGLMTTLAHLGRASLGEHAIETPVGIVAAEVHEDGRVSFTNIPSYREASGMQVVTADGRTRAGDIAWGGNRFLIVELSRAEFDPEQPGQLAVQARQLRDAARDQGCLDIDHVLLQGPPTNPLADARNFVLCPSDVADRSPCGTGTSAVVACLAADGRLAEGKEWVQESITGSLFSASYRWLDRGRGRVLPHITGRAFITAESTLLFDAEDPGSPPHES
jgi:4-hydroxyproline epimerase